MAREFETGTADQIKKKNGPWFATGMVFFLWGVMVRYFWYVHPPGVDRTPYLVLVVLSTVICVAGLGWSWIGHFRALRAHRNRKPPLSLG